MLNDALDDGLILANPAVRLLKRTRGLTEQDARTVDAYTKDELGLILQTAEARWPEWGRISSSPRLVRAPTRISLRAPVGRRGPGEWFPHDQAHGARSQDAGASAGARRGAEVGQGAQGGRAPDPYRTTPGASAFDGSRGRDHECGTLTVGLPFGHRCHQACRRSFHPLQARYRLLRIAGLRSLKLHVLRHTYASLLLRDGESPTYVKEQMGIPAFKSRWTSMPLHPREEPRGGGAACEGHESPCFARTRPALRASEPGLRGRGCRAPRHGA